LIELSDTVLNIPPIYTLSLLVSYTIALTTPLYAIPATLPFVPFDVTVPNSPHDLVFISQYAIFFAGREPFAKSYTCEKFPPIYKR